MINNLWEIVYSSKFRKEYRKSKKQGKDMDLVNTVITELANDRPLPPKHRDHALTGDWKGFRECHVTPDWLLIYSKENDGQLMLVLTRLSSHSHLDL